MLNSISKTIYGYGYGFKPNLDMKSYFHRDYRLPTTNQPSTKPRNWTENEKLSVLGPFIHCDFVPCDPGLE